MKAETFLRKYVVERKRQISFQHSDLIGVPWDIRKLLAEATTQVDYKCDFKDDGICHRERRATKGDVRYRLEANPKCCCAGCDYEMGYLKVINPNDVEEIASYFKPNIGFWRAGKGCALPRVLRSKVCLTHHCRTQLLLPKDRCLLALLQSDLIGFSFGRKPQLNKKLFKAVSGYNYGARHKALWTFIDEQVKEK